ncbi:hypothetical protein Taro_042464 [Colocasia esculenta]|uniref:Uncharacterized protein n=1 Tax=Colocasia esculenta TaxID=4460 RepID=A0A843WSX2_COLES|nr:hypothetical protein [Colocasia esculenta]
MTQLAVVIRVTIAAHFSVAIGFPVVTHLPIVIRLVLGALPCRDEIVTACGGATLPVLPWVLPWARLLCLYDLLVGNAAGYLAAFSDRSGARRVTSV